MGTNLEGLGPILGFGENVLRGLNPKHCDDGLPTEGCFILKANDRPDDGPSFGILRADPSQLEQSPLGVSQGVTPDIFATLMPSPGFGVAQMNVADALTCFAEKGAAFIQKDAEEWGEYKSAHCMVTGYQQFTPRDRRDLQRHLAKVAAKHVLKAPVSEAL